jgi:hypothetical protein
VEQSSRTTLPGILLSLFSAPAESIVEGRERMKAKRTKQERTTAGWVILISFQQFNGLKEEFTDRISEHTPEPMSFTQKRVSEGKLVRRCQARQHAFVLTGNGV